MANEQKNKEILADAFKRWHESKGGTVAHWMQLMADDGAFHSLAAGNPAVQFTESRHGKAAISQYFDGLVSQWTMINYKVHTYVAEGDHVVAIGSTSWRNKATGKTFDTPKADVVKFRDGKIVSFFEYYDTAQVLAAAT